MTSTQHIEARVDAPGVDADEDTGDADAEPFDSDRDRTAEDRDDTSEAHDETSDARDERADARDKRAEARDEAAPKLDAGAVSDRAGAKRDRQEGATDRKHAQDDREAAATDRALSARERAVFLVDELTGAHRRDAGILELERETTRASRTDQPFVLAFIDVDGLKITNDSLGHAAGDELLRGVVESIRQHMRSYDLIVRYGGDEFLCGLLDLTVDEVAKRFELVNAELGQTRRASVTIGLAELRSHDRLEDLIKRADDALYATRARRSAGT
jgi:diguanylate cyclase (GGDEF)-like protein